MLVCSNYYEVGKLEWDKGDFCPSIANAILMVQFDASRLRLTELIVVLALGYCPPHSNRLTIFHNIFFKFCFLSYKPSKHYFKIIFLFVFSVFTILKTIKNYTKQ